MNSQGHNANSNLRTNYPNEVDGAGAAIRLIAESFDVPAGTPLVLTSRMRRDGAAPLIGSSAVMRAVRERIEHAECQRRRGDAGEVGDAARSRHCRHQRWRDAAIVRGR